jgi:hypothetical protein
VTIVRRFLADRRVRAPSLSQYVLFFAPCRADDGN